MGNSGNSDTGTGELAPHTGEFLAGVLALSRISRVTVALESGHGAGPALLAAARLTAHAETCLLFDRWRGEPLANLSAALFDAHPDLAAAVAPDGGIAQALRTLQSRERHSLLIIFDRFDEYLAQPADQPQIAAFDQAFVQMANDSELDIHFLLVQDETAEPLLNRYQNSIPGIGDGCLRMPVGGLGDSQHTAAVPDASRASRRDRSFGMLLERLTAIAPVDEAAPGQPRDFGPAIDLPPADARQPLPDAGPEHQARPMFDAAAEQEVRPVFDDAPVYEAPLAEPEAAPLASRIEPSLAPVVVEEAAAPPLPPTPADPPARGNVLPASPPRRGKAFAALMVAVLAVGAGFYAYRQQAPAAAPGKSAETAQASAPAAGPTVATPPVTTNPQPSAPAPAPAPVAPPPALAAATPAPPDLPVTRPDAPATPAKPAAPATPVANSASSPAPARGTPTVFVHVRSQRERERLQSLAGTLAGKGIRVVDVKVMNTGPSVADLRYFHDEDRETALTVQKAMISAGVLLPRLSRMNGYEASTRPGHFEAWLGGDKAPEPVRRR